ncbi:MAG TPA: hypothetical protein DEQ02_09715 [Ruminococcaceae bacterium]|nr:hypothetical protein [Oscillospiraceae bacterium]
MSRLRNFMSGRNGMDELTVAVMIFGILLSFVSRIFGWSWLLLPGYAGFCYCVFRMLSRNIYKRRKENMVIASIAQKLKSDIKIYRRRYAERKTFRYFKCPKCKNWLKVPKGRGKIDIRCAKCAEHMVKTV